MPKMSKAQHRAQYLQDRNKVVPDKSHHPGKRYRIYYTDGKSYVLRGSLHTRGTFDGQWIYCIGRSHVDLLDPRAVIVDLEEKVIVYDPRVTGDAFYLEDWLNDHPEWPGILELDYPIRHATAS
jgi:hypothetical protein